MDPRAGSSPVTRTKRGSRVFMALLFLLCIGDGLEWERCKRTLLNDEFAPRLTDERSSRGESSPVTRTKQKGCTQRYIPFYFIRVAGLNRSGISELF